MLYAHRVIAFICLVTYLLRILLAFLNDIVRILFNDGILVTENEVRTFILYEMELLLVSILLSSVVFIVQ